MEEKELTALETDHSRQIQGDALEKLYNVFNCQRGIDDSKEYKSIINILRNSNKKLKNIYKQKLELLSLPMVEKWHVN